MDSNIHSKYYFSPPKAEWAIVEIATGNIILVDDNCESIMFTALLFDNLLYGVTRIQSAPIGNDKSILLSFKEKLSIHSKEPSKDVLELQEKLMFVRFLSTKLGELATNAKTHHSERIADELNRLEVTRKFMLTLTQDESVNDIVNADIAALKEYYSLVDGYISRFYRTLKALNYDVSITEVENEFKESIRESKQYHTHSIHQWFDDAILELL